MRTLTFLLSLAFVSILVTGCKKKPRPAIVETAPPSAIADFTASGGGVIYYDGGSQILEKGICWSDQTEFPDTDSPHATSDDATDPSPSTFTAALTGLKDNTNYYVRAYVTTEAGTSYGTSTVFRTKVYEPPPPPPPPPPGPLAIVFTKPVNIIVDGTSAALGGTVEVTAATPSVSEAGICWTTGTAIPTTTLNKIVSGVKTGAFQVTLNGLQFDRVYKLRAYATNSTGTSYGAVTTFSTFAAEVKDPDNNIYKGVRIGTQIWLAENYRTTRYRDGSSIPAPTTTWTPSSTAGAYCFYDNDDNNASLFGPMYSYPTLTNSRGFAPLGWHVPNYSEWLTLVNYLGGQANAADQLKLDGSNFWPNNSTATNSSGLAMLPGGYRNAQGGFAGLLNQVTFWSSTFVSPGYEVITLKDNSAAITFSTGANTQFGYYVRLIKD